MQDLLRKCRENFSEPPRSLSWWDRMWYLRISKPAWLHALPEDKLTFHFENIRKLFSEGVVVWGYIIQANGFLMQRGRWNLPGEVVYSVEDALRTTPEDLRDVSYKLGRLKGNQPSSPDLQRIAEYLTDERIRVFGLPVPASISPNLNCRISTTFFVRKHLPQRRLCSPLLPLLVHPRDPFVVTTLPQRYWPPELVEWWKE